MEASSTVNLKSMYKALGTPVIFDEIFRLLSFKDRKTFREVGRLWLKETEAIWRRETWMKLSSEDSTRDWDGLKIFLEQFLQTDYHTFDGELKEDKKYDLQKQPFRRFHISEHFLLPFTEEGPKWSEFFWGIYGTHITHLELQICRWNGTFTIANFLRGIFLEKCPNLVEFTLDFSLVYEFDENTVAKRNIVRKREAEANRAVLPQDEGKLAEKLKKFHFIYFCELNMDFYRNLFKLMPNIKDVAVRDATILPILAEERIQVDKFKGFSRDFESPTTPILNYVTEFPTALKELDLGVLRNTNIHSPLHGAILNSQSLTVLRLIYHRTRNNSGWFTELRGISLPNLTELDLKFQRCEGYILFDFLTLKGTPNLKILSITTKPEPLLYAPLPPNIMEMEMQRLRGAADWICKEPEIVFNYPGHQNVEMGGEGEHQWTGCKSLWKFTFDGWQLNQEDVNLFRGYFPNLEYLGAALNRETLPMVCSTWGNIKRVCLKLQSEDFPEELLSSHKQQYGKVEIIRQE